MGPLVFWSSNIFELRLPIEDRHLNGTIFNPMCEVFPKGTKRSHINHGLENMQELFLGAKILCEVIPKCATKITHHPKI